MMPLNKILVPIDLSENGGQVLAEAQRFASTFSATIDLVYVWAPPALAAPEAMITGVGVNEQPLLEWLRASATEMLSKFESDARSSGRAERPTFSPSFGLRTNEPV